MSPSVPPDSSPSKLQLMVEVGVFLTDDIRRGYFDKLTRSLPALALD